MFIIEYFIIWLISSNIPIIEPITPNRFMLILKNIAHMSLFFLVFYINLFLVYITYTTFRILSIHILNWVNTRNTAKPRWFVTNSRSKWSTWYFANRSGNCIQIVEFFQWFMKRSRTKHRSRKSVNIFITFLTIDVSLTTFHRIHSFKIILNWKIRLSF